MYFLHSHRLACLLTSRASFATHLLQCRLQKNIFSHKETRFTYSLLLSLIPKVCILIQISTLFHLQPERKQVLQDLNVVFTFTQVGFPLDQQGQLRNPPLAMQVVKACFLWQGNQIKFHPTFILHPQVGFPPDQQQSCPEKKWLTTCGNNDWCQV